LFASTGEAVERLTSSPAPTNRCTIVGYGRLKQHWPSYFPTFGTAWMKGFRRVRKEKDADALLAQHETLLSRLESMSKINSQSPRGSKRR